MTITAINEEVEAMIAAIMAAARTWAGAGVTFAHLERTIYGFGDVHTLYSDESEFVEIWTTISHEAKRAIQILRDRGEIHFERGTVEAYALDGYVSKLRVEPTDRPRPPKWYCWRPTIICLGPAPEARGRP